MSDITVTHYKCTKCGATDLDRGVSLPAPQVLNCWSCGAGLGMDPQQMARTHTGMFPCALPPEIAN